MLFGLYGRALNQWAKGVAPLVVLVVGVLQMSNGYAQSVARNQEIFAQQSNTNGAVHQLDVMSFGDSTDIGTGATSFLVTDIELHGNSGLKVALQRSLRAYDNGYQGWFSWTNFEVPYLFGVFAQVEGWSSVLSTAPGSRCSLGGLPVEVTRNSLSNNGKPESWFGEEYWHGNSLRLPGGATESMLWLGGESKRPMDGKDYRWLTKSSWYFSCGINVINAPGEGFLAVDPNGTRYYFNYMTRGDFAVRALHKPAFLGGTAVLRRKEVRLMPTRIEDRFGNWVTLAYEDNRLTGMVANDGRHLDLTYVDARLSTVSDGSRSWVYSYPSPYSVKVTYPDQSTWESHVSGPGFEDHDTDTRCQSPSSRRFSGEYTVSIKQPSSATGTFRFQPVRTGFSFVPERGDGSYTCTTPPTLSTILR